jgi:hypothetical protein
MRHPAPSSQRPSRRRNPATGAMPTTAQDRRYRRTPVRRQPAVVATPETTAAPVEAVWPDWIVPAAMGSVMLMISTYHHAALFDAVLRLF